MGRGKSKAKQAKVARELKYGQNNSDLEALAKELLVQDRNEEVNNGDTSAEENGE